MVLRPGIMSTIPTAMPETSRAFDREAQGYAERWDRSPIVPFWRGRVLARAAAATPPGGRIADLGLGTGTDALCLEAAGFEVCGIDASVGMVSVARARGINARFGGIEEASSLLGRDFDTVLCNFGVMNCLTTLSDLARELALLVRPGGRAVLVWMSPHCPADSCSRLLRLQRPRRGRPFAEVAGVQVPLSWWSLRQVKTSLKGEFDVVSAEAIGLLDPPPEFGGQPGWHTTFEPWIAGLPGLRLLGDHTLLVVERRA